MDRKRPRGEKETKSPAVPNWFDLPLLVPDVADPVLTRIQRKYLREPRHDSNDGAGAGHTDDEEEGAAHDTGKERHRRDAPLTAGFTVPRLSRLSPQKSALRWGVSASMTGCRDDQERDKHVAMQEYVAQRRQLQRRRSQQPQRAPVVLNRLAHQTRSRLRNKLWTDLNRYGLWRMDGSGGTADGGSEHAGADDETSASVNAAVDAIMTQWGEPRSLTVEGVKRDNQERREHEDSSGTAVVAPAKDNRSDSAFFLTSVPDHSSQHGHTETPSANGDTEHGNEEPHDSNDGEDHLEEDDDDDDSESAGERAHDRRLSAPIAVPGAKRRNRLKDLQGFVEKQLQKRLFRSWETIEIALSGSGDLTVAQIVKFLQNSDVQLSAADAAKVQSILNAHVAATEAAEASRPATVDTQRSEAERRGASEATITSQHTNASAISNIPGDRDPVGMESNAAPPQEVAKPKRAKAAVLSYEAFRKVFQPTDTKEASRWKREFDREKVRRRQEKEIYERELAALEEKVRQRLAASAKQMVEVLDQFHCDPRAIPWNDDESRLEMREQFLQIIFSKPAKRRPFQALTVAEDSAMAVSTSSALALAVTAASSTLADNGQNAAQSIVPERLAVPLVRSALLQKYSRNGHFESIPISSAAYIFHDMAADRIKLSVRALWTRRSTDQWPERQLIFQFRRKKSVFQAWSRFTRHAETLRVYVMRKFVAWKFWTRKRMATYAFFRVSFWPFYTWKRHLQQMIIARGKSAFLRSVVLTYIQLRHYRAWKTKYRRTVWNRKQIHRLRMKRRRRVLHVCWTSWHDRYAVQAHVHRLWKSQGHVLQRLHKQYMVKITFLLWRYYTILRQDMAARSLKCLHAQFPPVQLSQQQQPYSPQRRGGVARGLSSTTTRNRVDSAVLPSAGLSGSSDGGPTTQESQSASMQGTRNRRMSISHSHVVEENDDADNVKSLSAGNTDAGTSTEVRGLSRILETDLAPQIKRKTRLYDLCLVLYLRYRERDRREMTGNIILFRRVGRIFLSTLQQYVMHSKKNRFASDLGAFRILQARFRRWMAMSVYKNPISIVSSTRALLDMDATSQDDADSSDEGSTPSSMEVKTDAIILDWKNDTVWRRDGLANLAPQAQQIRLEIAKVATDNDARRARMALLEEKLGNVKRQEDTFLRKQAGITLKIRAMQSQQAQQLLRDRANRLHDALDRGFDQLLAQQRRQQLKSSFRAMRVLVLFPATTTLCYRAQMRNWLRICHRFRFWESNMTRFYHLKLKFHAFRTLLRHVAWKWRFETSGLSAKLQQRQRLTLKYEAYLTTHGLLDGSPAAAQLAVTRFSPANSLHAVFLRWTQFTQLSYAHNQIVALMARKKELWRMHSVFYTLRTPIKAKYTFAARHEVTPFLYRQCMVDLDDIHCKILAFHSRLGSQQFRRQISLRHRELQHTATGAPTLKQLFQQHETEVHHRLNLEKRLMFAAYHERRVHHYAERQSSLFGAKVGRAFTYENAPPFTSISEVSVLCGKTVDGIALVLRAGPASSATLSTVEGALHGNPFGNREVFPLARGEKLVGIEGMASQSIFGLRFATSTGRFSRWFGQCDRGTKFELYSEWGAHREEIVGLFGYADATSLHALGAVFRRTTLKNIFEGMWLHGAKRSHESVGSSQAQASSSQSSGIIISSGLSGMSNESSSTGLISHDDAVLSDRQFVYFLQIRTCDVLTAMKRAHQFALRVHRVPFHPVAVTRPSILMGIMRWLFDALTHGLVRPSTQEEEGRQILHEGLEQCAAGEKAIEEGRGLLAEVDTFRDDQRQLNVATLGVKKITDLKAMIQCGEQKLALGKMLVEQGNAAVSEGRRILPHIPMTKRMTLAIRRMYRVVQTKDYIDQMDPDLRAILLEGEGDDTTTPMSIYDPL